jgi:hypothetical protein
VRTLALAGDKYTPHVMIALSDFMIRNRLGKSSATFTSNTLTYSPTKNKNAVALGRRGGKAKSQTYPRRAEGDNGEGARKPLAFKDSHPQEAMPISGMQNYYRRRTY